MPVAQEGLFDVPPAGSQLDEGEAEGHCSRHCARQSTYQSKVKNRKGRTVRTDIYTELYLWNKNLDSLIRVLQRVELLGICPKQLLKQHETRLEELRAALNADLLDAPLTQETADKARYQQLVALRPENAAEKGHLH